MNAKDRSVLPYLLALVAAMAIGVPYLLAVGAADGRFTGFLLNPLDGFTYLAKMAQGYRGEWLFKLPYTPDPGPGALVYVYYLGLGHLARLVGLPLITVFHIARTLCAALMFSLIWILYGELLTERRERWFAYGLTLAGAGLGWLAAPIPGLEPSDLMIPESIPFLTAYANAHFPLAEAALVAAVLAMAARRWGVGRRTGIGLTSGAVLGAVLPFSVINVAVLGFLWLVWVSVRHSRTGQGGDRRSFSHACYAYGAFLLGAAPWLAYDFWLSRFHPALAAWTGQNQTPSPSPINYLIGFGLPGVLALISLARARRPFGAQIQLTLVWLVSGAALLYAPFALQRRLSLGLFLPIAVCAARGWGALAASNRRFWTWGAAILLLALPSNLLVVQAGLFGVRRGDAALLYQPGELQAYSWAEEHLPPDAVVLASPQTGNRLPAFAPLRVLYGHPFETPHAESQKALVEGLYSSMDTEAALRTLHDLGVTYVFYGPAERALGDPAWLDSTQKLYRGDDFRIFGVGEP